jgi:hypothetical protein
MRVGFLMRGPLAGVPTAVMLAICARGVNSQPARTQSTELIVQRALPAPDLDGRCDDPAYERSETVRIGGTTAVALRLTHSGVDAYLCLVSLPMVAEDVLIRVDPVYNRREKVGVPRI